SDGLALARRRPGAPDRRSSCGSRRRGRTAGPVARRQSMINRRNPAGPRASGAKGLAGFTARRAESKPVADSAQARPGAARADAKREPTRAPDKAKPEPARATPAPAPAHRASAPPHGRGASAKPSREAAGQANSRPRMPMAAIRIDQVESALADILT